MRCLTALIALVMSCRPLGTTDFVPLDFTNEGNDQFEEHAGYPSTHPLAVGFSTRIEADGRSLVSTRPEVVSSHDNGDGSTTIVAEGPGVAALIALGEAKRGDIFLPRLLPMVPDNIDDFVVVNTGELGALTIEVLCLSAARFCPTSRAFYVEPPAAFAFPDPLFATVLPIARTTDGANAQLGSTPIECPGINSSSVVSIARGNSASVSCSAGALGADLIVSPATDFTAWQLDLNGTFPEFVASIENAAVIAARFRWSSAPSGILDVSACNSSVSGSSHCSVDRLRSGDANLTVELLGSPLTTTVVVSR